ncbi:hypothetical protein AAY473_020454, partial [Plecturocebus cupreus]
MTGWAQWLKPVMPELWEVEAGKSPRSGVHDHPGQHGEAPSLLKYKISWVWWHMYVVPSTQEAETGELLEPRRQRLQLPASTLQWLSPSIIHRNGGLLMEAMQSSVETDQKQRRTTSGRAQWLTPVIPALCEAKAGKSLE